MYVAQDPEAASVSGAIPGRQRHLQRVLGEKSVVRRRPGHAGAWFIPPEAGRLKGWTGGERIGGGRARWIEIDTQVGNRWVSMCTYLAIYLYLSICISSYIFTYASICLSRKTDR